jgi:Dolichyl-phosphate-mannose-protein mannosyltransferase
VSKSHGKSAQFRPPADGNQPPSGVKHTAFPTLPISDWAVGLGVAALAVAYLAAFFSTSQTRLLVIAYVLMPDELVRQWAEGSWSQAQFIDRAPILLCGSVILLGCYFLGRVFLRLAHFDRTLTNLERTAFSVGIGLHLQSLFTLLVGLISLPIGPLAFVLLWMISAGSMLALWWLGKLRYEPDESAHNQMIPMESVPPSRLVLAATWSMRIYVVLCSLAILFGSMLPPVDFDVREYHLQVPKEWNERGGIDFLPHNVYGNMPLGAELHSIVATQLMPAGERPWWWGALTAKLVMASYGPLTALAVYAMGRRFISPFAGLAAAAIYISSPWVVHVCITGYNEVVLGYYLVTSVYVLLMTPHAVRSLVIAGVLAGAAASCKYTGVVFVVVPLAILALVIFAGIPRWNATRGLACAAALLVMVALSCGLWYGKNWMLTGNPTYPLMSSIFDGKTRTPEKNARWDQAHKPRAFTLESLSESAQHVLWKSNFHDPLSVPLATLGIVGIAIAVRTYSRNHQGETDLFSTSRFALVATVFVLIFILTAWWLFTHRLVRFLVPVFPLVVFLAGAGVEYARMTKSLRYVVAALMFVGLTYNLLMAVSPLVGDNRWFVSLERLRVDEPKTDQQLSRVNVAHRWLNANVKEKEAVLCVGDAAVFDLEMPVYYNTCFDDCLLVNWMEGKTPQQRRAEFKNRRVAYVYFDEVDYNRYISRGNYGFDPRFSPALLQELVRQGVLNSPLSSSPPTIFPVAP